MQTRPAILSAPLASNTFRAIVMASMIGAMSWGLSGCADPILTTTVQAAFEDRKTGNQITDTKTHALFLKRLAEVDKKLLLDVSTDVWEGRFMLTGTVDNAALKSKIADIARVDKTLKKLHNEIQVVSTGERDQRRTQSEAKDSSTKSAVGQAVNDFWIEAKIKGQLVSTRGLTSVNYRWRSVRNHVFMIGRARSAHELNSVLSIVRATGGVKSVKHFIEIKLAGQD